MNRKPWPARWGIYSRPTVSRHPIAAGESFVAGDLVRKNGSDEIVEVTETTPTNLFGFAAEGTEDLLEDGFVMVYELKASDWWGMMGTRDPVAGDVGDERGVRKSGETGDVWGIHLNTTGELVRVKIEQVDTRQNYYYVSFLPDHIQS